MHRFTWCNERAPNVRNRQEDGWLISDGRAASRFADVTRNVEASGLYCVSGLQDPSRSLVLIEKRQMVVPTSKVDLKSARIWRFQFSDSPHVIPAAP